MALPSRIRSFVWSQLFIAMYLPLVDECCLCGPVAVLALGFATCSGGDAASTARGRGALVRGGAEDSDAGKSILGYFFVSEVQQ